MKRDPVEHLQKMLNAAINKLDRLSADEEASAAAVEDARVGMVALQRELALAREGKLPSALDALRGL